MDALIMHGYLMHRSIDIDALPPAAPYLRLSAALPLRPTHPSNTTSIQQATHAIYVVESSEIGSCFEQLENF